MTYLLRNVETGKLVAATGARHPYTVNPRAARKYATLEQARKDACSNERPVSMEDYASGF